MQRWFPRPADERKVLLALCLLPAGVLAALAARGGWYADDLDFLVHGRRGFSPDLLLTPVNDHVAPGLRLTYAIFATVDGPSWGLTVVTRAALWYLAVVLFVALVTRLTEVRWAPAVAAVLYGFSSVSMPSFMSLSSAVNTIPAQVLGLVLVHASLDAFTTSSRRPLVVVAAALAASMMFWEKSGLVVLTAAAVVVVAGVPAGRRAWARWAGAVVAGVAVFAAIYLPSGGAGGQAVSPALVARLTAEGTGASLLPALVGGPWRWSPAVPPYFGLSDPTAAVVIAGVALFLTAVVLSWRYRPRVLALWGATLLFAIVGTPVVALGRYSTFGDVLTRHQHYWADAAIPMSLALVCTLAAIPWRGGRRVVVGVWGATWVAGTVVSFVGFAGPWGQNTSRDYLERLTTDIDAAGSVNLWDTRPALEVMPYISENRRVSGLVGLTGANGATTLASGPQPQVVDDTGSVRPAVLRSWAAVQAEPGMSCTALVQGATEVTMRLDSTLPRGDWAVQLPYLARPEATVRVFAETAGGERVPLLGDGSWESGLSSGYAMVEQPTTMRALVLVSQDADANICLGDVQAGVIEVAP